MEKTKLKNFTKALAGILEVLAWIMDAVLGITLVAFAFFSRVIIRFIISSGINLNVD